MSSVLRPVRRLSLLEVSLARRGPQRAPHRLVVLSGIRPLQPTWPIPAVLDTCIAAEGPQHCQVL